MSPEDLQNFIYALFHSATYRVRFAAELEVDFPRVLIPRRLALFEKLSEFGSRLASLHLRRERNCTEFRTNYQGDECPVVGAGYPKYQADRVYLNADTWFGPNPSSAWEYRMGTHQVLRKWLKDRRGQRLSSQQLSEYSACVESVGMTIDLVKQIDTAITSGGGWPDAFCNESDLQQN